MDQVIVADNKVDTLDAKPGGLREGIMSTVELRDVLSTMEMVDPVIVKVLDQVIVADNKVDTLDAKLGGDHVSSRAQGCLGHHGDGRPSHCHRLQCGHPEY